MSGFTCPFCKQLMAISRDTFSTRPTDFHGVYQPDDAYSIEIQFYRCPNCKTETILAVYKGTKMPKRTVPIFPISQAIQFPEYVPQAIRSDYEEACAIVSLSPKASATLARRCLQGMIRDFWKIKDSTLAKEIDQLQGKIPAAQWNVLNGVRRIGNIGAHMEKDINLILDIEPDDAQKLVKLLELLIQQWYIDRHDQELLYQEILGIDAEKQAERTSQQQN